MKRLLSKPTIYAILILAIALFFTYEALACKSLSYDFEFVGYGGTFKHTDLSFLGIPIYWVMMIIGQAVTIAISFGCRKKYELTKIQASTLPIIFLIVSLVGGKLLYVLEYFLDFREIPTTLGGLSLFGAILLVPLVSPLISLLTKKSTLQLLDLFTIFGIVLLAFMRIGCFFSGCCGAITIWNKDVPVILPVQLFEAVIDLIILQTLLDVEKKHLHKGYMYPLYMVAYGLCRFLLEFLRKSPSTFMFLSNGQIFALISALTGLGLFFLLTKISKAKS